MSTTIATVTGNTFSNGDSATATKLNNVVNAMTFTGPVNGFFGFDGSGNPVDGSFANGLTVAAGVASLLYRPVVTAGTFSATSSTTLTNVTGLSLNLVTGKSYTVSGSGLINQSAGGGGIKIGFGGSATVAGLVGAIVYLGSSGAVQLGTGTGSGLLYSKAASGVEAAYYNISGSFVCSGSGTFTFQLAQLSSDSNPCTLQASAALAVNVV